jgi:hypothetical protein
MSSPTVSTEVNATPLPTINGVPVFERENSYFGSLWDFVRLADGRAFWIHASGKSIPASGNNFEKEA